MGSFRIQGGVELCGEVTPQGAKNEALEVISAVLLTAEEVEISNVPDIHDVNILIEMLKDIGVKVTKTADHTYIFKADEVDVDYLHSQYGKQKAKQLRGSIMILGPLLARFGRGYLPKPGGDKIGRRRVDTHFDGFIALGAKFNYEPDSKFYSIEADKLKGTYMLLDEASVTGTANIIMAAVLADGKTTIYNAACEPYVQQLCRMLIAMGADIKGVGSNLLTITGVEGLHGCKHRILADMLDVGSWMGLAAMTRSDITIKNVGWDDLGQIPRVFERMGIEIIRQGDDMRIPQQGIYEPKGFIDGSILTISDAPWPGFTPDLLSIILVLATQAKGSVLIHQKMFESRLFFTDKLIDMGAKIILCDPHRATVIGLEQYHSLRGSVMVSPDIRAGNALLIAALSARGESVIHNIEQIDRGYERIEERLTSLGAQIVREE
ncbi:MAG: UDP-N-acetylglucosamine 1-carboxyvinyltransferase [Flavobacteriales bacterium]|nr:UDP-N-acetylglucosamine 1-carboxyvinyltransferase [Flavobacteriales bacterium]